MTTSPNLGITHLQANSDQPEVPVNAAVDKLDQAGNDTVALTVTGNTIVTAIEFNENYLLILNGAPAADFTLTVPANKRKFAVENNTGRNATVTTGSGATVVLSDGQRRELYCDATNVKATAPDFNVSGGGGAAGAFGPASRGALVGRTTTQSIANVTDTAVQFDQEQYDTDAIHDSATNNSRLTVPAGVTKVRLAANVEWDNLGAEAFRQMWLHKNGALFPGSAKHINKESTQGWMNVATGAVEVTAGDYFELIVRQSSGSSINIVNSDNTWFSLEIVERTPPRALIKLLADQPVPENAPTVLMWDAASYDPQALFTLTSPTKLVVPANAAKARLSAAVRWEPNATGYRRLRLLKHGSPHFDGNAGDSRAAASGVATEVVVQTPVLDVSPGDAFEVEVTHGASQSGGINVEAMSDAGSPAAAATWFALEIVE
jgi:hypothetical protein